MSVLACDLGGTRIKLGLVENGRLLASDLIVSHSDHGLRQALERIAEAEERSLSYLLNLAARRFVEAEAKKSSKR